MKIPARGDQTGLGAAAECTTGQVLGPGVRVVHREQQDNLDELYALLADADVLAVRAGEKGWLVVMALDPFRALLAGSVTATAQPRATRKVLGMKP
jgi:hypothetical protein